MNKIGINNYLFKFENDMFYYIINVIHFNNYVGLKVNFQTKIMIERMFRFNLNNIV
jgi:hypothetical protein